MEGVERLYYGLGLLAYAVAKADGKVDPEERQKLHDIVDFRFLFPLLFIRCTDLSRLMLR